MKELGGELILECRPELIRLIESMKVVDRPVPKGDPLPDPGSSSNGSRCRVYSYTVCRRAYRRSS